ncbi:inner membrane protein [Vibrio inusitatus NBRC 102082]|uniref:Inner membrane protein n=1 Tax=Vibrio inusitatus NBRC 102082 TaxID=1219070 RepID=A0A4Y3HZQ2_9VIBR|nr:YbaN family protein [Vibrio inusitatus]GEA52636.1 inner membrane protein [Vibrio inusitatus NBRC 102082]
MFGQGFAELANSQNPIKRWMLISLGVVCLVLGLLGVVLPLLPTTPFVLLASACFMRSSPRLNKKLLSHPTFGPIIKDWQYTRGIKRSVKRKAYWLILFSFALSITLAPINWVRLLLVVIMAILLLWLSRLPEPAE